MFTLSRKRISKHTQTMRKLERVNIDIAAGEKLGTERRLRLETGYYDRFQIINRKSTEPSEPVEIQISDVNGYDLVPRVSIKALEPRGAAQDFYNALPPIEVEPNVDLEINLHAAANLAEAASFQIVFWKSCDK